jgi:hypothetical protein
MEGFEELGYDLKPEFAADPSEGGREEKEWCACASCRGVREEREEVRKVRIESAEMGSMVETEDEADDEMEG